MQIDFIDRKSNFIIVGVTENRDVMTVQLKIFLILLHTGMSREDICLSLAFMLVGESKTQTDPR